MGVCSVCVPCVRVVAGMTQVAAATVRTTQLLVLVVIKSVAIGVYKNTPPHCNYYFLLLVLAVIKSVAVGIYTNL